MSYDSFLNDENKYLNRWAINLLGTFMSLMVIFMGVTIFWFATTPTETPEKLQPVDCELYKELPLTGGYFWESEAGEYHYEVFTTQSGVKVFKCPK